MTWATALGPKLPFATGSFWPITAFATYIQCSKALERPLSFMSDAESGTRRLDIAQPRDLCKVLGIGLEDLIAELEKAMEEA